MKIVCFLQNQWFRDPERMRKIQQNEHWRDASHHRWVKTWLFFGCLTGRRLQQAFGEELCDQIIWEEISKELGGKSSSVFPPDFVHMLDVVQQHKPTHIIALGKHAAQAVCYIVEQHSNIVLDCKVILGPHPAARHATVVQELRAIAEQLKG